ncbi:hypothetical protein OE88DRAFT_1638087, partial [Heliocybe sulcata]
MGTKGPDRLYHLDEPPNEKAYAITSSSSKLLQLHCKLGHIGMSTVKKMVQKGRFPSLKISKAELDETQPLCASCMKGKMTRASFLPSESGRTEDIDILGLIHSDVWGKAQVQSISGSDYLLTLTD